MRHGDVSECGSWYSYGCRATSVADARVETIQDGIPDSRPLDPNMLDGLTGSTLAGNYVILDLGNDEFALYGHLKPGSISVKPGQTVKKGQVIGLVGNSGNSDIPHIHFQVNRHTPVRGEPIPYGFEQFEFIDRIDPATLFHPTSENDIVNRIMERVINRIIEARSGDDSVNLSRGASIEETIRASLSHSRERDPDPGLDLGQMGEMRTLEMPLSGSVIRF